MVLELDTGRCVNLLAILQRGVDRRRCVSKNAGPKGAVDLMAVLHRSEKGTSASKDVAGRRKKQTKQIPTYLPRKRKEKDSQTRTDITFSDCELVFHSKQRRKERKKQE